MSAPLQIHESKSPGLVTGEIHVEEVHSANGQHYWKAMAPIGHIFGEPVEGFLTGYGHTREQALEHLEDERNKLYESLW